MRCSIAIAVLLLGCGDDGGLGRPADGSRADAARDQRVDAPADAQVGSGDGATADAARLDAMVGDGAVPDALAPDGSVQDAPVSDAPVPEASAPDAAVLDAITSDAAACSQMIAEFAQALDEAKSCSLGCNCCTAKVVGIIFPQCPCPTYVNASKTAAIAKMASLRTAFAAAGCTGPVCACANPTGGVCQDQFGSQSCADQI